MARLLILKELYKLTELLFFYNLSSQSMIHNSSVCDLESRLWSITCNLIQDIAMHHSVNFKKNITNNLGCSTKLTIS